MWGVWDQMGADVYSRRDDTDSTDINHNRTIHCALKARSISSACPEQRQRRATKTANPPRPRIRKSSKTARCDLEVA